MVGGFVTNGGISGSVSGEGPPVLVLHGGPGLSDYTPSLDAELAGFSVIRFQQRGLAPSVLNGPFTVEQHVLDAVAVLDHVGVDQPLVIGHSWGGHLALHFVVAHPARVSGLLILDPLGAVPDGGVGEMQANLVARTSPEQLRRLEELGTAPSAERLRIVWPGYFADPLSAPPMPPIDLSPECSVGTWASIFAHFEAGTLVGSLPLVTAPCTVVLGEKSPIPVHQGEKTAALVPHAQARIEPDTGHFLWLEKPGVLRGIVTELA
jgi:proline iminopeptidase